MAQEHWMERLADRMELTGEPLPGQSLVELAGDRRVLVEQHKGICQYSPQCITVKVSYGELIVKGKGLQILRMAKEQLVIKGCIDCVCITRRRSAKE